MGSCVQVSHHCGDPHVNLIRMLCPATCRCFYSKPSTAITTGCPLSKCRDNRISSAYYDLTPQCKDEPPSSLLISPHWVKYWESRAALRHDPGLEEQQVFALRYGCSVIQMFNLSAELCADNERFHSLGSFCPEACECGDNDYWGCSESIADM